MKKDHNFKEIPNSQQVRRVDLVVVKRWHCADCDSVVEYPAHYTRHEVNHVVAKSNFQCLPPMGLNDYADTSYFDKKGKAN